MHLRDLRLSLSVEVEEQEDSNAVVCIVNDFDEYMELMRKLTSIVDDEEAGDEADEIRDTMDGLLEDVSRG